MQLSIEKVYEKKKLNWNLLVTLFLIRWSVMLNWNVIVHRQTFSSILWYSNSNLLYI